MKRVFLLVSWSLLSGWLGCEPRLNQETLEGQVAASLKATLVLHQNEFPNAQVTNVAELFENPSYLAQGYPHFLDEAFRAYGKSAGFTNSFYEKYVLVPPGIRHRYVQGEVVLLNAKPFPNREGKLGRMIISRTGSGYAGAHVNWYPEDTVQEMFRQAGVNIPAPPVLPPAPTPPATREVRKTRTVEGVFRDLAETLGLQRSLWLTLLLTIGVVVLLLVSSVAMFWWVRRR